VAYPSSVEQIEDRTAALAAEFPDVCAVDVLPEPSVEGGPLGRGRVVRFLRIGTGVGEGRSRVLLIGGVHSREWAPPDALLTFLEKLLRAFAARGGMGYAAVADPRVPPTEYHAFSFPLDDVRQLVENLELYVVPLVNPDGRAHTMPPASVVGWRKNRRPPPPGVTCPPLPARISAADRKFLSNDPTGVDLNRNFDVAWDIHRYYSRAALADVDVGESPCVITQTFHGSWAASEPETRNVQHLITSKRIQFFMDIHSFGRKFLFPWGIEQNQSADPSQTLRNPAHDRSPATPAGARGRDGLGSAYKEWVPPGIEAEHQRIGALLVDAIRDSTGHGAARPPLTAAEAEALRRSRYGAVQSISLSGLLTGASKDFAFSQQIGVSAGNAVAGDPVVAFTFECGHDDDGGFWPAARVQYPKIEREVGAALMAFLKVAARRRVRPLAPPVPPQPPQPRPRRTRFHRTSALEFQTTGIVVAGADDHVVRVLGALPELPPARQALRKEDLADGAGDEVYERYFSGELHSEQEDPEERPFHPSVPALFITQAGEPLFLERDWTDLDPADVPPTVAEPAPAESPPAQPPLPAPLPTVDRWGSYDLQRADRDATPRWGGAVRSATAGDPMPAAGTDGFVRRLQADLRELGFLLVGTPDGSFGRATEWAVREFQIYAKMANVAQEVGPGPTAAAGYLDRLSQVANTQRYTGPVSGVLNADTRARLRHWLTNRWRCPVVVEARNAATGAVVRENLWLKDDEPTSAPRIFARDFSGYYTFPTGQNANEAIVLGDYQTAGHGGPSSRAPMHTWPEAELLPEHLVGSALANLTAAQLSTYKVVRSVSEVECMGFFDSLNAWDNAIMSLGPCHWTLGLISGTAVDEGELCAYLSYLRDVEPADFAAAIEFFGMRTDERWTTAANVASGVDLFGAGLRKYTGWVAQQQENGGFVRTPATRADADYFRTWHWFHRFQMAGRTVTGFRRRMWDMARIRLRDIRSTPWGPGPPAVPDIPVQGGAPRPATIGDVFTSERALALFVRWHVWRPAHIVSGGNAGLRARNALANAAIPPAAGDPSGWSDAHEQDLIDGIMAEVAAFNDAGLTQSMTYVRDWHTWGAGGGPRNYALPHTVADLAATRGSLQFDASGLPPTPY
jgi:hypothetical protein